MKRADALEFAKTAAEQPLLRWHSEDCACWDCVMRLELWVRTSIAQMKAKQEWRRSLCIAVKNGVPGHLTPTPESPFSKSRSSRPPSSSRPSS